MSAAPSSLPTATPVPTWASDRRRATRYPSRAELVVYPTNGSPADAWPATVRDVSDTGIGLVLDQALERGLMLVLAFPATEGSPSSLACACVQHSTKQPEGNFLVGCTFQSELTPEILQALIRGA